MSRWFVHSNESHASNFQKQQHGSSEVTRRCQTIIENNGDVGNRQGSEILTGETEHNITPSPKKKKKHQKHKNFLSNV